MAGLLLAAMLVPMLPAIELPVAHAEGGTSVTNNYYYDIPVSGDGTFSFDQADSVSISGANQNMTINSDQTDIIVMGDYYKETFQFDPKVGELYLGNNLKNSAGKSLWTPTLDELPTWLVDNVMYNKGYAALYTGFMEHDNTYTYKPRGATRVGEVLGYDIYAAHGEEFFHDEGSGSVLDVTPTHEILEDDSPITEDWAVINAYRAIGVNRYHIGVATLPKDMQGIADIVGDNKCITREYVTAGGGKATAVSWDINKSPVIQYLTGNITSDYKGDSEPVVIVYATRTYLDDYKAQAAVDLLEYDGGYNQMTGAQFCKLVADLMEAYGEPVITEQEQYMLLEAYGRKLPYDLFPAELEAVKYLMVRGIIDGTDELQKMAGADSGWTWHSPITFEQATTILMRVKDKGSRLTFKEFQLTTDLELLKRGYYPTDVAITDTTGGIFVSELGYLPANESTHYDYFLRRTDNRALFLSADEKGEGSQVALETDPHVSTGEDRVTARLANSYYRGRTKDGWYWFQVPIGYEGVNGAVYVNSAHSEHDSPAQYTMPVGGGYYVATATGDDIGTYHAQKTAGFGNGSSYVDKENFAEATRNSNLGTAAMMDDKNRTTSFVLEVHRPLVVDSGLQHNGINWMTMYGKLKKYVSKAATDVTVWVKDGEASPKYTDPNEDGWVACRLYRSGIYSTTNEYITVICEADEPITKAMAQAAFSLHDNVLKEGLKGDASPFRTMRAYCRFGDEYLVSVEYLKSMEAIDQFLNYAEGKYYMSVPQKNGASDIDVYFDTTRGDTNLVLFGNSAYVFSQEDLVVNQMGDDVFVLLDAVTGRLANGTSTASIELPGDAAAISLSCPTAFSGATIISGGREGFKLPVRVETSDNEQKIYAAFVNLAAENVLANYLAVFDKRYGNAAPVVYTLYETGQEVTSEQSAIARAAFEEIFGWSIGGKSMYYKMVQASPEVDIKPDGTRQCRTVSVNNDTSQLWYSESGELLVQIPIQTESGLFLGATMKEDGTYDDGTAISLSDLMPDNPTWRGLKHNGAVYSVEDYWTYTDNYPILPYYYTPVEEEWSDNNKLGAGYAYSWLTNWDVSSGSRKPVTIGWVSSFANDPSAQTGLRQRNRTDIGTINDYFVDNAYAQHTSPVTSPGSLRMQVCGLSALLANFTVGTAKNGTEMSSLLRGNRITTVYFGCDPDTSAYSSDGLPFDGTYYAMHLAESVIVLQVYNGELKKVNPNAGASTPTEKEWSAGEPNKITDWLMWLKEAKLSDAEDILTICIIAVLQWLPRIFMFIFFLLMGLSMIASMKPWVIFCDRYFDPYKFLTAGRVDVHTIEIKKVVLCSMIALVLFGFFQNGLILDIIAWCARAVTGMLNR